MNRIFFWVYIFNKKQKKGILRANVSQSAAVGAQHFIQ